ncbi:MAG: ATP-binding protein [Myxococcales bacterium]|nr:ATP-binding protein [Myxococcales bacterium]
MSNSLISISELPIELTPDEAVEETYREDLDWIEEKLRLGLSVLVECDKQLTLYLYRAVRNRLRRGTPPQRCVLISGHSALENSGPGMNPSLMQGILSELRQQVYSGEQGQILVLPHLDVLTTTTKSGLNVETREAIAMVFENPNLVMLGFKDPLFEIPAVMANVFTAKREIIGIPRDALPRLIVQREARKFAVEQFNPFALYKYVSGLNAVRFRQIMNHFTDRVDFDEMNPGTADDIYREIRQMTISSDMELPSVDIEKDIGGYKKVKTQLEEEVLSLLRYKQGLTSREEIQRIEEIVPKGMIFLGPPGTGKTFFAKAMATALNATVSIVSGPELKSKWVGESEENLRRVFARARRSAPSIIVFDEIDSFATARGTYTGSGVEHSMVNQLLTEMDGFRKEEMVFVVGTTNFSESLDPALLRPGRFELLIEIPYPGSSDRRAIGALYKKKFNLDMSDEMLDYLVDKTGGYVDDRRGIRFSGDHIYAVFRALKRELIRKGGEAEIDKEMINRAISTKRKKKVSFSDQERRTIAIHEAGHAICAHYLPHASTIEKITIATDDTDVLGYVLRSVRENKYVTTQNELLDDICVLLGGRVAESIAIGDISVGAYDDLQKATLLARSMIEELGMGQTLGLRVISGREGLGRTALRENVSDTTEAAVDQEVRDMLEEQRVRAEALMHEKRQQFDLLVETLLTEGTIEKDRVVEILGEPVIAASKKKKNEETANEREDD